MVALVLTTTCVLPCLDPSLSQGIFCKVIELISLFLSHPQMLESGFLEQVWPPSTVVMACSCTVSFLGVIN